MSSDPTRHRLDLFEQAWGDRARAADADWSRGLSADERMTIVDDLFSTIRTARQGDGEWASSMRRPGRKRGRNATGS